MKLTTTAQMRAIEKEADAKGTPYAQIMQNAGTGLAKHIHTLAQHNTQNTITGIIGTGNNGGDTLIALTTLVQAGWQTHAYLVNRNTTEDPHITQYLNAGGNLAQLATDPNLNTLRHFIEESNFLLDGLLGTGTKLPLRNEAALVLQSIANILTDLQTPPHIIAVDCPSGIDCDTGDAAKETLPARLTITLAALKQGMIKLPAYQYLGKLKCIGIGLPQNLDSWNTLTTDVADDEMISALLPDRNPAAHKGTFGTALVIAGSASYTGAALLAGTAAYRIGAGLVTMAIPEPLHPALAGHLPEATWVLLPHEHGYISETAAQTLLNNLNRTTAILIGPGIGDKATTKIFIEQILPNFQHPIVIDADGLRHLASIPLSLWERAGVRASFVLTPHPGEMSALTGLPTDEIQADRQTIAERYAREWGHVVVLKGAFTVIAAPDGRTTIIPVATPALARAGTGDVLAGLIVGLRAQGVHAYEAAIAGAYLHAQAGLHAAEEIGTTTSVLASNILASIPTILHQLKK